MNEEWYYRTYLNPQMVCEHCKQEFDAFMAYGSGLGRFCTKYCHDEYKREKMEGVSPVIVSEINLSGIRKGWMQ